MRIKQLEIVGFKSFANRTVLDFPDGITAIVGPNGCGKSNVVDAIRWVLGEQSPKHLRGESMEDVIFNGNERLAATGMAQVSLTFHNNGTPPTRSDLDLDVSTLPAHFRDLAEITVTRRYFRSGESEYFINKTPCRLKDITELFLGTGVGTKAYAIIEQGRVDQLISAKPEELRLFLEEAAGTTRFRARRIAAERKMERTRENLLRVQDVVRELERQMGSLQRQARRAEEYHRLKDELRRLDWRVLGARRQTLDAEIAEFSATAERLVRQEQALLQDLERLQVSTDAARMRAQAAQGRLREVEADLAATRLRAAEMHGRASTAEERRAERERGLATAVQESDEVARRLADAEAQERIFNEEHAGVATGRAAAEEGLRASEHELRELDGRAPALEAAVETAKEALLDLLAEESRVRNLAEALGRRQEELAGRRLRLEEEQRALGQRLDTNDRERGQAERALERLRADRTGLDGERAAALEDQRQCLDAECAAQATVERAREQVTQLASRADSLRELQARYEGCTRGVASLLSRGGEGRLLADVLHVPAGLERAVAAALGARL